MITLKDAIDNIRRQHPTQLLMEAVELDNGYFFFAKERGATEPKYGAAGIFVDGQSGAVSFEPLSFLAYHDLGKDDMDISRFQTPEESREKG